MPEVKIFNGVIDAETKEAMAPMKPVSPVIITKLDRESFTVEYMTQDSKTREGLIIEFLRNVLRSRYLKGFYHLSF